MHVFRELRRKQLKIDKGRGGGSATVSLAQLKRNFASLSNYEITSRLRDRCECHPLPVRGFTLPSLLFLSSTVAPPMPAVLVAGAYVQCVHSSDTHNKSSG